MTIRKQIDTIIARNQKIAGEIEALAQTPEDDADGFATATASIKELNSEFDGNEKKIDTLVESQKRVDAAQARLAAIVAPGVPAEGEVPDVIGNDGAKAQLPAWARIKVPARAQFLKTKVFDSNEDAYFAGLFFQAVGGSATAKNRLKDVGFDLRKARNAQEEGTDSLGGFTVPTPLAATIIRLVEEYGVARQHSRNIPMSSATLDVPKRAAGLTITYPGEGTAITPSDVTFAQVNLVAKKSAYLNLMSTEVNEDSIISMTDLITTEMAWGFAADEDRLFFTGDGSAGDNSITGIGPALQAGAKVTGGASWGAYTWDMYHEAVGSIAYYAGIRPAWFINHQGYAESMQKLAYAQGGNTVQTSAGGMVEEFMGYPVVKTQALPRVPAASSLAVVFGDLAMGTLLGTRRDVTIKILHELYAASDQIGIVATKRHDSVVHDVGDATNAGSIVGIYGA